MAYKGSNQQRVLVAVSDAQMRRDANNNKGYNDRVERMEVALRLSEKRTNAGGNYLKTLT